MSATGVATGPAKRAEVGRLMKILEGCTPVTKNEDVQQLQTLTQLKIYGRDPKDADAIFCKDGILTLARLAFAGPSMCSQEALRCIANALLLAPNSRQVFMDLELVEKATERFKSNDYNDEFLISRILFLLTYGTDLDYDVLLKDHSVADSINTHLETHSRAWPQKTQPLNPSNIEIMALSETLKLLFNLSSSQEAHAALFQPSIEPVLSILSQTALPTQCLEPPINVLINALVNLNLETAESETFIQTYLFPEGNRNEQPVKIFEILDKATKSYSTTELESSLPPLLTVIRKLYDSAPGDRKKHMQQVLLPLRENRDLPIGQSDTLPSRLLRLSTSAMAPTLREIIPTLMFELSEKDAKIFIDNIGYGFAAGFLASHGIPMPGSAMHGQHGGANGENGAAINPITGQRFDMEPEDDGPPMTEEEKEREAERLFVLFERLRATGVVDVRNPVQQAREEGRFEEVEDSD